VNLFTDTPAFVGSAREQCRRGTLGPALWGRLHKKRSERSESFGTQRKEETAEDGVGAAQADLQGVSRGGPRSGTEQTEGTQVSKITYQPKIATDVLFFQPVFPISSFICFPTFHI
jgi:hypothetical protein